MRSIVTHRLKVGETLAADDLERDLLLANDFPGIRATGLLEAGETHASKRLLVHVDDTPVITGDLGINNHGVKSTGLTQAVGGVPLNNPAGIGDQLSRRDEDDQFGAPSRRHDIDALTPGLSGDLRDSLGGGRLSWGVLQFARDRVRACPVNAANGERGLLVKLELQRELGSGGKQPPSAALLHRGVSPV